MKSGVLIRWLIHIKSMPRGLVQYGISVRNASQTQISFAHNSCFSWTITLKFCTEQNFKLIGQLKRMLWKNEILQDLSSRWLSDVYPILHSTPVFYWEFIFAMLTMFIRYFVIAITSINLSNFTSKISCQNPKLRILPLHGWLVAYYQTF